MSTEIFNNDFVYLTCGDLYYMDIIEKLVISLSNVSSRKIMVYGINCKVPFDYPNLIKKELIIPTFSIHDKWFWKQQACIEVLKEKFDNYVWVDGDIIANNNIDSISKYFLEIDKYPICDIHVQDEQIMQINGVSQFLGEHICKYFGIKRKLLKKDLHACFFIFNDNCRWFFEEILHTYKIIYDKGLYDDLLAWNDESLHNFMMCKYGFTKTLPLSNLSLLCDHTKYDSNPKLLKIFYSYWNDDSPNNFGEQFGWSYVPEDKNQIFYFHENKNLKDADEMIQYIKMRNNDSFNSSKCFFINKQKIHNFEDNRVLKELDFTWQYLPQEYDNCSKYEYKTFLMIEPNDIVVDTDADIGFFERYCYLKNASKIICFEWKKDKFEILKLNAYKDTIIFNSIVSNIIGDCVIETDNQNIVDTYTIDYLFDAELIDNIDLLKISNNVADVLNGISDINLQKIKKISIYWDNFQELLNKNEIVEYYLIRGFNCWVYVEHNNARLYLKKI